MGLMDIFRMTSKAWAKTIVAFEPPSKLRDIGIQGATTSASQIRASDAEDRFKIRLAHSDERSREARFLVRKRYSEAGYGTQATRVMSAISPERITLLSYHGDKVVGTMTIGLDTGHGLYADEHYKDKVDELRAEGRKIFEITKLAVDTKVANKQIVAALMHIAYIYARRIWRYTDVVIEVNPSHAAFYTKMLGFREYGPQRLCGRVNAPALLLWLEMDHMGRMIAERGGKGAAGHAGGRSFYPYFFSPAEEAKITRRLMHNESLG
jgi:hypothetical protein